MGLSTVDLWSNALRQRAVLKGATRMGALLSTSLERLERTFSRVITTVVQERRSSLQPVQQKPARAVEVTA